MPFLTSFLIFFLLLIMRKKKGALWLFAFAWSISLLPIMTGVISYAYLPILNYSFDLQLALFLSCFVFGLIYHDVVKKKATAKSEYTQSINGPSISYWLKSAWIIGVIGTTLLGIDYLIQGGVSLDDMSIIREQYINRQISTIARLSSILTWGCFYSFAFAAVYRKELSWNKFALYASPILGYFLVALLSAGRQASMQILLFTLLSFTLSSSSAHNVFDITYKKRKNLFSILFLSMLSLLMIIYMGYVAVDRNDGLISNQKSEVLMLLFDFTLSPSVSFFLDLIHPSVGDAFVEGLVYLTSPVALFSQFLLIEDIQITFGAMNFPFVMRQLEPVTELSVVGVLINKIQTMSSMGVIGAGWTTSISAHIQDFGKFGACLALFIKGYCCGWSWKHLLAKTSFHHIVVAILLAMSVIYMPLLSIFSDTSMFLLLAYCMLGIIFKHTNSPNHR